MIAGDAAHLMPPFLGQGMCTGIRDVANLGWKLAAVLRWQAPDALLDSYAQERREHTRTYIDTAVRVGEMMNSAETAEALTHAIRPDGAAQMNSISRDLDHAIGPQGDEMRGIRMPQPRLETGELLGDVMAGRFAIIGDGKSLATADLPPGDVAVAIDTDLHSEVAKALRERGISAMVLRPDFYCFGSAGVEGRGQLPDILAELRQQSYG